jgi:hypothetical protein
VWSNLTLGTIAPRIRRQIPCQKKNKNKNKKTKKKKKRKGKMV